MFDIERALVAWLPGKCGCPCYGAPPEKRPERFVTVERTGGATELGADRPLLAVQAWARSRLDASSLAAAVRSALVLESWEIPEVCNCKVTSTYSFPDPDSRAARYQMDVEMVTNL